MTVIKIMTLLVIGFNPSVLSTDNLRNLFFVIYIKEITLTGISVIVKALYSFVL